MKATDVLQELQRMGTAQNRKVYGRHGVVGDMFGVSYANLNQLRRKIKIDHSLALQLWESEIHDARVLATMIADPKLLSLKEINRWCNDLDNYVLAGGFTDLVAKTPHAYKKMKQWIAVRSEWKSASGWALVASLASAENELDDSVFVDLIETIEQNIGSAPNRTRHSMALALIRMGCRSGSLERKAIAAAKRIGRIDVDHGETSCKTPDVVASIKKTRQRTKPRRVRSRG